MEKYLTPLTPLLEDAAKMVENLSGESPEIQSFVKDEYIQEIYRVVQVHLRDCTRCRFQSKVAYEKPKPKRHSTDPDEVLEARPLNADELGSLCKPAIDTLTTELDQYVDKRITGFLDNLRQRVAESRPSSEESSAVKDFIRTHKGVSAANLREVIQESGKWIRLFDEKKPLVEKVQEMEQTVVTLREFYRSTILPLASEAAQKHAISNLEVYVIEPSAFVEAVDAKLADMNAKFKNNVVAKWEETHQRTFHIEGTKWADVPDFTLLGQDFFRKFDLTEASLEAPVAPVSKGSATKNSRSMSVQTPPKPAYKTSISSASKGLAGNRTSGIGGKKPAIEKVVEEISQDYHGLKGHGIPLSIPTKVVREKPDGRFDHAIENEDYKVSIVRAEEKSGEGIDVFVRIRPLVSSEKKSQAQIALQVLEDNQTIQLTQLVSGKPKTQEMAFANVFNSSVSQTELFNQLDMSSFVDKALDGLNCTLMTYGQTGSGKTFSLSGPTDVLGIQKNVKIVESIPFPPIVREVLSEMLERNLNLQGVIPQIATVLFDKIAKIEHAHKDVRYKIKVSFVEMYNEKIQDLLVQNVTSLNVREYVDGTTGFYVEGVTQRDCATLPDFLQVLVDGTQNRTIYAHSDSDSSRSHLILSISLERMTFDSAVKMIWLQKSKISLVDLGGSETAKSLKTTGSTPIESAAINKSLIALSNLISNLSEGGQSDTIAFRNSKLTMLLMDSLVGAGSTYLLACCSPSESVVAESTSTLQLAAKAANISKKSLTVLTSHELEVRNLKKTIEELKKENDKLRHLFTQNKITVPVRK